MTNEEFADLLKKERKVDYLLGQIHGQLYKLIENSNAEILREDIVDIFDYITNEMGRIYYK